MKTCKDCIHRGVCILYDAFDYEEPTTADACRFFKDKSKFIELPCSIGDYCIWKNTEWYVNVIEWDNEDFVLWVSPANRQACSAEVLASEVRFMTEEEVSEMFERINADRKKYLEELK